MSESESPCIHVRIRVSVHPCQNPCRAYVSNTNSSSASVSISRPALCLNSEAHPKAKTRQGRGEPLLARQSSDVCREFTGW
jgi:hypothetical protein